MPTRVDSVQAYFDTLPNRFVQSASKGVDAVFQFEIKGAGTWVSDARNANTVTQGDHASPDCTIQANKETFDNILDNPSSAMTYFMSGALRADNLGLARQLQSFIG